MYAYTPIPRRHAPRTARITAEAIAAFRAGRWTDLHRALGLRPWETSPLDATDGPSPHLPGSAGANSWGPAIELRRALERAGTAPQGA